MQFLVQRVDIPLPFFQLHLVDISNAVPAGPYDRSLTQSGPIALALQQKLQRHIPLAQSIVSSPKPSVSRHIASQLSWLSRKVIVALLSICLSIAITFPAFYIGFSLLTSFESLLQFSLLLILTVSIFALAMRTSYRWLINSLPK